MADTPAFLQELHGLRLDAPGFAEVALALGAGLILAALIGVLLQRFRQPMPALRAEDTVQAARELPEAERVTILASLLRELTDREAPGRAPWVERARELGVAPNLLHDLGDALYRPDASIDVQELERAVLGAARKVGG